MASGAGRVSRKRSTESVVPNKLTIMREVNRWLVGGVARVQSGQPMGSRLGKNIYNIFSNFLTQTSTNSSLKTFKK